ncbi:MAG: energy transducer TonB [Rhodothermales bacterium]|nr:energy transducer TonB [Rhodothermales bacterium]
MRIRERTRTLALLVSLLMVAGCSSSDSYRQGPPEGWVADGSRWFLLGLDTTGVYPDLTSLETMEVAGAELTYSATAALSRRRDVATRQLSRAVKQSLIALIRNEPHVVDSLFEKLVVPKLENADLSREPDQLVERYKKEAYRTLARHFREPRATVRLGSDVPVVYPDSLRQAGITGDVDLQVYVNEQGEPAAIELLQGVHPVLDDIAMSATTEVRWQPAYLLRVGKSYPIPSWLRYSVKFRTQ